MYYKTELGKMGENIAVQYLISKEYKIIERNFRCRQGEIDIVAIDENELVFIEVKTRTSKQYGNPSEAVDYTKMNHILRVAEYYIYIKKIKNTYMRIDVIEVMISRKGNVVRHLKQVV